MRKKKLGPETSGLDDDDVPSWVDDESPGRASPYSEEELDLFVEGTLEGIEDTAAWRDLVDRVGEEEARRELRARLVMMDENTKKLTRH